MFPHRVEFKIQSSSQECSYLNKLFSYDPSATNDLDGDNRVELSFSILSETIVGNHRILIDMKRKKKYLDTCYLFLHLDLNLWVFVLCVTVCRMNKWNSIQHAKEALKRITIRAMPSYPKQCLKHELTGHVSMVRSRLTALTHRFALFSPCTGSYRKFPSCITSFSSIRLIRVYKKDYRGWKKNNSWLVCGFVCILVIAFVFNTLPVSDSCRTARPNPSRPKMMACSFFFWLNSCFDPFNFHSLWLPSLHRSITVR